MSRIAILGSRGYPSTYGGFETFVRRLAPHLAARGHHVTVYCRARPGEEREWWVDGVRCVYTRGIDRRELSTLTHGMSSAVHARGESYDVALVLNVANGFALPLLRRARTATIVNVDGIEWRRSNWNRLAQKVLLFGARATARWADQLVADSQAVASIWSHELGRQPGFIPYGADIVDGPPPAAPFGLVAGSFVLVVARLIADNNIDLAIDAIRLLDPDVPVVVVGGAAGASPLPGRLRQLTADRPATRWLGHVDDEALLDRLWRTCGVYFHGHSAGGTNPSLLQALGCGSPVVAVDTPFNREVLGTAGELVAPVAGDVAHRLAELLADPSRRSALSQEGRALIGARYRWDDVCRAYEELLVSEDQPSSGGS